MIDNRSIAETSSAAPSPIVAVCGPTASGKSALALLLARALDGEIINVDSVQVYRGCDIGSAKLSVAERAGIPHHLIDIRDPNEQYNVAIFAKEAWQAAEEIRTRGRRVICVGGTGLYLSALLHGLAELPSAESGLRRQLADFSDLELWQQLQQVDPGAAARLNSGDRRRTSRALESFLLSGVPASQTQSAHGYREKRLCGLILVLCWPRADLYARINDRSSILVSEGIVDETARLTERYGEGIPPLAAIGYAQSAAYLRGELVGGDLAATIALHTRRFAKRQTTFWRNEPPKRGWLGVPLQHFVRTSCGPAAKTGHRRAIPSDFAALEYSCAEVIERIRQRLREPFDCNEVWYLDANRLISDI